MTAPVFTGYERRRRSRTRHRIVFVVAVLVAFGFGLALGEAIHDNPKPGGTQRLERTLPPPSTKSPGA